MKIKFTERTWLIVAWVLLGVALLPWLHYGRRALICDRFIVRGDSMEPTLHSGTPVWVNKLKMGARIYTKFDFDGDALECFRLPGFRPLRVGDIAVYNYQYGHEHDRIGFKINYVYAKRCVGCPGDTVSVVDCHYVNSSVADVGVQLSSEARLRAIPDSVLIAWRSFRTGRFAGERDRWTLKDFGPIVVPGKGMTVRLDSLTRRHYGILLTYETGLPPAAVPGETYTFREDYYFFAGDNVPNSRDSRYDGFVPERFVIGIIVPPHAD